MQNEDKVTLTIGQIKKLIKEAKSNKKNKNVITYDDVLNHLEGMSTNDLQTVRAFPKPEATMFLMDYDNPVNGDRDHLAEVMYQLATKIVHGIFYPQETVIASLRKEYKNKQI